MLTVAILSSADPDPLARTFRCLVGATVSGVVSDVLVVSDQPEALAAVCEPMGAARCTLDQADAALAKARGEWLLLLEAGAEPLGGWDQAVADHARPNARPARFEIQGRVEPFWRRLFGQPKRPLMAGFLLPMRAARNALRTSTLERLPTGRAAVTLNAGLRPADV